MAKEKLKNFYKLEKRSENLELKPTVVIHQKFLSRHNLEFAKILRMTLAIEQYIDNMKNGECIISCGG